MRSLDRLFVDGNRHRTSFQSGSFGHRIGSIDIQVVVGDNVQMVPQLLLVVFLRTDLRIEQFHHLDDRPGLLASFFLVLDVFELPHHIIDDTAVLRKAERGSLRIIIQNLFHNLQR